MEFLRRLVATVALATALLSTGCATDGSNSGKGEDGLAGGAAAGGLPMKNPLAMAELCQRRGQFEEAKKLFEETIRRKPKDSAAYRGLALLYAHEGKFKEARARFDEALALSPDDADLLGDMGYFCYLAGQPEEAEKLLRRAVELEPNRPLYANNLGLVLGEQGRYKEALAMFRRFGRESEALANLAFVYTQRGEYDKALQTYNRVLTEDPGMRSAAEAMVQVSKAMAERRRSEVDIVPGPPAAEVAQREPPRQSRPSSPAGEAVIWVGTTDQSSGVATQTAWERPPTDRESGSGRGDGSTAVYAASQSAARLPATSPVVSPAAPSRPAAVLPSHLVNDAAECGETVGVRRLPATTP